MPEIRPSVSSPQALFPAAIGSENFHAADEDEEYVLLSLTHSAQTLLEILTNGPSSYNGLDCSGG